MGLPTGSELLGLLRLARDLRPFSSSTLTPEICDDLVRARMRTRELRLIALLDRVVFSNPRSPYFKLMNMAGAQAEDVRGLIASEGVEAALAVLGRQGIRVSWEEFKGRTPVVRGSARLDVDPSDFDNPVTKPFLVGTSGGTSGGAVRVATDLEYITECAPNWGVWLEALGLRSRPLVFWAPTHTGLANRYLLCAKLGLPYRKWFAMADMRTPFDRLRSRVVHRICQAALGLPRAVTADLGQSAVVMSYLADLAEAGEPPMINTSPSAAVKISTEAVVAGRSLDGVAFLLGAEPVTPDRREAMEAAGALCVPTYGTSESGWIGAHFTGDTEHDEVRVFRDAYAVLPSVERPEALEFTSLITAAHKILLNVELGDSAVITEGAGGEPAERWGYDLTLHTIRTFRKITSFGVTFAVADLYPILEKQLPQRFGGTVGDYQLEECQDTKGTAEILLRISPELGPVDDKLVIDELLSAISATQDHYGPMADMLRDADALVVRRERPRLTAAGKVFPVLPAAGSSNSR